MASNKRSFGYNLARTMFSFFCSPLDALWGLGKGTYYFLTSPHYWWAGAGHFSDPVNKKDKPGTLTSATYALNRIFTVATAVICVLGFIGALAVPIPGVAPLYTAGVLGIAKAAGITIGWSTVSRVAGSFLGSLVDFCKFKSVSKATGGSLSATLPLKMTVKAGLFGEAIEQAQKVFKSIGRYLACCFCKKVNPPSDKSPKDSGSKKPGARPSASMESSTYDIFQRTTEKHPISPNTSEEKSAPRPIAPPLQKVDSFGYVKSPAEENLSPPSQYCYENDLGSYVNDVTQFSPSPRA